MKLWVLVFVAIGLAAIQGALYHGFRDALPPSLYFGFRVGTLWSLSLTAYALGMALLSFGVPRRHALFKIIQGILLLKAIVFLVLAVVKTEFGLGIMDYGSSFILAFGVHLGKYRHPASRWILSGVAVSIAAAIIQQAKISPSLQFNYNDLYHVVQLVGLYLFYKGACRVSDAT
jgi:hypothetical protein